jgi:hypothetical protein
MSIKIGLDLGMSSTKLVGENGEILFFNQAALMNSERMEGNLAGMKARRRPMIVKGDFGEFYVGKNAHDFGQPVESFDFDQLTGTNEMRALVYGALTAYQKLYGVFEEPLAIAVGLPLQLMTGDDAKKNQATVIKWLNGHHEWNADGEVFSANIEKVYLAPQALGALFDYVFDAKGMAIAGTESAMKLECAEVSIGSNSVELMVTKRNSDTERFNGGKAVGVRKLFQRIDPKGLYTYGELDMKLRGKDDEFDDEMKRKLPEYIKSWSIDVKDFINKKWEGAHERFHRVFLVGGGAFLLEKELMEKFNGRAYMPENPVMSIARGLYKLLLVNK